MMLRTATSALDNVYRFSFFLWTCVSVEVGHRIQIVLLSSIVCVPIFLLQSGSLIFRDHCAAIFPVL